MGFPLRLPVWSRGSRERNREGARSALEGRVAANGPRTLRAADAVALRPSLTAVRCYAWEGAGRTEGWSFQSNIGGGKGRFDISRFYRSMN